MKNTHIAYGFLTALVMIIVGVIMYVAGISMNRWAQYIAYIPFLIGIILNAQAFSKANNHNVTFGNVFSSCFKMSAIITLVMLVWSFIFIAIFPEMKEKGMEMARQSMTEKGMSDAQIEQGIQMSKKYFNLFMAMGVVFGYMFVGIIFSLIGAALAKKNPQPPTVQSL